MNHFHHRSQACFLKFVCRVIMKHMKGQGTILRQIVHNWKSFITTTYSQTLPSFAFHKTKNQYLNTLHIQCTTEKWNAPSDAQYWLWCTPQKCPLSAKLQIAKIHLKMLKEITVICTTRVGCSNFHRSPISPKTCISVWFFSEPMSIYRTGYIMSSHV